MVDRLELAGNACGKSGEDTRRLIAPHLQQIVAIYSSGMRRIIIVVVLALAALGQTSSTRVPPDEAAKHILSKPSPVYPSLAEQARIQGNVILEATINESGAVSAIRLVSGHPMLVQAAFENVKKWKFRPFEVDGKPVTAQTFVIVTFGDPSDHGAADRAEMLFQHDFWTAEESAQADFAKADYSGAENQQSKARDLLVLGDFPHPRERWRWATSMGNLAMAQRRDEEAEQYYKQALALYDTDKDAPEVAATLAYLGNFYAVEKQYDLARDTAAQSIAIYEKNFKNAGSSNPGARQTYGRAIAYQSWMLSKLARQQNNPYDVEKNCRTVLDFQVFLTPADHDSFISACGQATATPTSHN